MKKNGFEVREIEIAKFQETPRALVRKMHPMIVQSSGRAVAIVLPVETTWFGRLEHPVSQKRILVEQLDAVLRKLSRTFVTL